MVFTTDGDVACGGVKPVSPLDALGLSRLASRTLLPFGHVAEISLDWKVAKPGKSLVYTCLTVVLVLALSLSLNMFLFRRVSALEEDVSELSIILKDLVQVVSSSSSPSWPSDSVDRQKREVEADKMTGLPSNSTGLSRPRRRRDRMSGEDDVLGGSGGKVTSEVGIEGFGFRPPDGAAGIKAVQFRPCLKPVIVSDSRGVVNGWRPDWATDPFRYQFDALRSQVTVLEDGLYYLYSQLYFFHTFDSTGYEVFLQRSDTVHAEEPLVVARCSLAGSSPGTSPEDGPRSEASCHTSAVVPLSRGDSIFLRIREIGRNVNLARGHSFFGLVKLGKKKKNSGDGKGRKPINDPQCTVP